MFFQDVQAQEHTVAQEWTELTLQAIRRDLARPTVHARNLWHLSMAMYDAWAAYDDVAEPYMLGKEVFGYTVAFDGVPDPIDIEAAREEAISHAAFTFLRRRYSNSPGVFTLLVALNNKMTELGYDPDFNSQDYTTGNPAALGNYIANSLLEYGEQDGANELINYQNLYYRPINPPLLVFDPGNPNIIDMNRWQPLTLEIFIDQSGNEIPGNTPPFLSPEWGAVNPFSMTSADANVYPTDDFDYIVYHDPGPPPYIDDPMTSEEYKWGFAMVSAWASHLDPDDETIWDISPASKGNIDFLPDNISEFPDFYDFDNGGVKLSVGHDINPHTGQPYEPQLVKRGDYARILAEFWADGPESETPPGHWFSILNYVLDHPEFTRKYRGFYEMETDLEFDVKAYFMLGAALHDCAVSAWGIKGHYDYIRPVSAIRAMCDMGQSSDENLPSYSPNGMPLMPGYIELVEEGDPLAGAFGEHVGKVKLYTWRGPEYIDDPEADYAGVGWILGENWWPYQRPSFVTPNFAGYISGHSTFSRAAAEILTMLTGDPYFPGGLGEFVAEQNEFLVFEEGPTETITLQWATYRDASDETSLSRIWGGIHPPADDIPGRKIGIRIANDVFIKSQDYFFNDEDGDGYFGYEDCDDFNPEMNPGFAEICDNFDNDCNGVVNDGVPLNTYYFDTDGDGFGEIAMPTDTCILVPPPGYVDNADDCNDLAEEISPVASEICDAIDNDCNGELNNGLERFIYYMDFDNDGYGDANMVLDTCISTPPDGFVIDQTDCNDDASNIYPTAVDIPDNGIDEDCNGYDLFEKTQFFPTGISVGGKEIRVHYNHNGSINGRLYAFDGRLIMDESWQIANNFFFIETPFNLVGGVYFLHLFNEEAEIDEVTRIIVLN